MADRQVAIQYRSNGQRLLLFLTAASLPFVAMFLFASLIMTIVAAATAPSHGVWPVVILSIVLEVLLGFSFASIFLVALDDLVVLTREGISCSAALCPSFAVRTELAWPSLRQVRLLSGRGSAGRLQLSFAGGRTLGFDIGRLTPAKAERLLLALRVWATHLESLPRPEEILRLSVSEGYGGYTQWWEAELGRRFAATNFVPLEPGTAVGGQRFTVDRQLAFGGLSAIYLARAGGNQDVVLKEAVLPPDCEPEAREKAVELFEREARLLAAIHHPHIVTVHDFFVENGRYYMVLDYLRGRNLRQVVREDGAQNALAVVAWARQVSELLEFLHGHEPPIIHRDISPDNLILGRDGTLSLVDFGAANLFLGTATGTMIGKQAYIAPEQLRGRSATASDLYGLGCLMYFLLTGRDPEPLSVSRPSVAVAGLPAELDDLIASLTAEDPAARLASAAAARLALERLQATIPAVMAGGERVEDRTHA